jgi:hypothetical protein
MLPTECIEGQRGVATDSSMNPYRETIQITHDYRSVFFPSLGPTVSVRLAPG